MPGDFFQITNSVNHKYKDLGDGSFAEVVALDGGSVTITGPVTVSNEVEIKNDSGSPVPIELLSVPGVARTLAVTATSSSVALTNTCKRISIRARSCDMWYVVGVGVQTATANTSHFIAQDERLDLAVPLGATIAAVRDASAVNGILSITELL